MQNQKGFTIIELIVVIAIIAVLAGIVLVNVTSYINKGKDAAIKGNLASLLTDAAPIFDTYGTYTNSAANSVCGTGGPWATSILPALTAAGSTTTSCANTSDKWCACASLKNVAANQFCVDSTGYKKETASNTCAQCNATNYACQ